MKITNGPKPVRNNNIGLKLDKDMIILVDSREQKPYWSGSECAKTALIVGDYTTVKLLNLFHIDRKSPADLYSTITKGHLRFKKEILRADEHGIYLAIYVESTREKFINKDFPQGDRLKYPTRGLDRILNTLYERYQLEIVFLDSREDSMQAVYKRLRKEQSKLTKGKWKQK